MEQESKLLKVPFLKPEQNNCSKIGRPAEPQHLVSKMTAGIFWFSAALLLLLF